MGCVLGRPGSPGSVSTRIESNRKEVNNVSVTKTETIQTTSAVVASASTNEEVRNDEGVVNHHKEQNGIAVTEAKERKHKGERRRSSKPDPRRSNPPKNLLGEQVAAGWPPWLSEVCGEALNGWLPRKADSFEKIEKVRHKQSFCVLFFGMMLCN